MLPEKLLWTKSAIVRLSCFLRNSGKWGIPTGPSKMRGKQSCTWTCLSVKANVWLIIQQDK